MQDFDDKGSYPGLISYENERTGPPRFLFWAVIGLFILFILGIIAGVIVFRHVLEPSQQQRVMDIAPFMRVLMPPTPEGGVIAAPLATADESIDPLDLLSSPLATETPVTSAENVDAVATVQTEPTTEIVIEATTAPTATPEPTITPEPTQVIPTDTPVSESSSSQVASTDLNAVQNPPITTIQYNVPASARLFGIDYERQTWNNCGPTNITMALSYFGWQEDQNYAASYLKPNKEDKNVSPDEMVNFVNEQTGVKALTRPGGSADLIKLLVSNDFPVIIETGLMPEGYDWIGHYRTIVGYDNALQQFYIYDSFLGAGDVDQGVSERFRDMDERWRDFNRRFIVIYQEQDEARLMNLLGELRDPQRASELAFETAQAEANANRQDAMAFFNMGTALTDLGDYTRASRAFDEARRIGTLPWRLTWYRFEPFKAYFETQRYDEVLSLVQSNLNNTRYLEEMYYWRGRVYEAQGNANQAQSEYRLALDYNRLFEPARVALDRL